MWLFKSSFPVPCGFYVYIEWIFLHRENKVNREWIFLCNRYCERTCFIFTKEIIFYEISNSSFRRNTQSNLTPTNLYQKLSHKYICIYSLQFLQKKKKNISETSKNINCNVEIRYFSFSPYSRSFIVWRIGDVGASRKCNGYVRCIAMCTMAVCMWGQFGRNGKEDRWEHGLKRRRETGGKAAGVASRMGKW